MIFNSIAFLLFFPFVCIVYYALPTIRLRNLFLLAASYFFYMNWEPVYALLLLASTGITYFAAQGVAKYESNIPFLDYHTQGLFLDHPECFRDLTHMWDKGSRIYPSIFAGDLKRVLGDMNLLPKAVSAQ